MDLKSQDRELFRDQKPMWEWELKKEEAETSVKLFKGEKSPKYIVKDKTVGIYIFIKELIN